MLICRQQAGPYLLKLGDIGLCCLQDEVRSALVGAGQGGYMLQLLLQAHSCSTQAGQAQEFKHIALLCTACSHGLCSAQPFSTGPRQLLMLRLAHGMAILAGGVPLPSLCLWLMLMYAAHQRSPRRGALSTQSKPL